VPDRYQGRCAGSCSALRGRGDAQRQRGASRSGRPPPVASSRRTYAFGDSPGSTGRAARAIATRSEAGIEQIGQKEAMEVARYLALVVGHAHARQMSHADRKRWISELRRTKSKSIEAPSWLWRSVVDLVGSHEVGYLEHCRRYALEAG